MAFQRVGQLVRLLREKAGLTQRALAESAGINNVLLHRIEVGDAYLASSGGKLAAALGPAIIEALRVETDLRHRLDTLRVDAEKAACLMAADAVPAVEVWTGDPEALTPEEAAEKYAAAHAAFPWGTLLTPGNLADRLKVKDLETDPDVVAVLQAACDRWLDYMGAGKSE